VGRREEQEDDEPEVAFLGELREVASDLTQRAGVDPNRHRRALRCRRARSTHIDFYGADRLRLESETWGRKGGSS
jgi:hypothetical protein